VKQETKKKYEEKLKHLRKKFRESEDEKIKKIPKGLEEFSEISVFDRGKFEKYEIKVVGGN
jgi:uncharacterized protein (DUF2461 family)